MLVSGSVNSIYHDVGSNSLNLQDDWNYIKVLNKTSFGRDEKKLLTPQKLMRLGATGIPNFDHIAPNTRDNLTNP